MPEKPKRKPCRCSELCPTWNRDDRDCEIYGWNHPAPSHCPYYAKYEEEEKKRNAQEQRV